MLNQIKILLEKIKSLLYDLNNRIISVQQIALNTLSDLSSSLGLIQTGEFRVGNQNAPGDGFSGARMGYPFFRYNGEDWVLVGVSSDEFQFGLSSDNGKAAFAGGNALIDEDGITGTSLLKWMIKQSAENDSKDRNFTIGMSVEPDWGTAPSLLLSYYDEESAGDLVSNGGAEDGDLSNWTTTTETNGSWYASSDHPVKEGTYKFGFSTDDTSSSGVMTSDRFSVTAGSIYKFSGFVNLLAFMTTGSVSYSSYGKIELKFWDAGTAGSQVGSTVLITSNTISGSLSGYGTEGRITGWIGNEYTIEVPTGATHAEFVLTCSPAVAGTAQSKISKAEFDGISAYLISVNNKLIISDYGIEATKGIYPVQADVFWDNPFSGDVSITTDGSQRYGYYGVTNGDDEDQVTFEIPLKKGTYSIRVLLCKDDDCGIMDISLDGTEIVSAFDSYNSSLSRNNLLTATGKDVTFNGIHELKFSVDGKNASSSDHYLKVTKAWMWRTGD